MMRMHAQRRLPQRSFNCHLWGIVIDISRFKVRGEVQRVNRLRGKGFAIFRRFGGLKNLDGTTQEGGRVMHCIVQCCVRRGEGGGGVTGAWRKKEGRSSEICQERRMTK